MSLDKISSQLADIADGTLKKMPPVELWDPPYCGEIDLVIKENGDWFYMGTPFKRINMVKLFASVLKKEHDEYFLVTPVEKIKITVEFVPFVITQWEWQADVSPETMLVSTNLDDVFVLNKDHPLTLVDEQHLLITVRRNLQAKVHRNVYYQWVDLAQEIETKLGTELGFFSANEMFSLGKMG